jgi:anti-sigma factor RsiW
MKVRLSADPACREIVEVITDYLEGRLPAEERARFDQHLSICRGCRAYLEQMRQVIRTAGAVGEESLDEEQRDRLVRAFRDWKAKKP